MYFLSIFTCLPGIVTVIEVEASDDMIVEANVLKEVIEIYNASETRAI